MTIDSDVVMLFAAIVVVTCTALYLTIFLVGRRMDREDALSMERLERRLDELLRH